MNRLVIAGGSGFLGNVLARYFAQRDWKIVMLTRTPAAPQAGVRQVRWDGRTLGAWTRELEGAAAVINLAGKSVDCRYHTRNRKLILDSRVDSTRVLGEAIGQCTNPPPVWLNSSTATIYHHSFDRPMDEVSGEIAATPEAKDAYSVAVALAWEKALAEAQTPRTRKVAMRTAMVLGAGRNSVFPVLRRLVRLGLGGRMASGQQYVSWIHQEDFCRAVEFLIHQQDLSGAVNLAAPNPLPNHELMRTLRSICGVPFGLPASQWMLEAGAFLLRTETELILKSRRVVPARLLATGFVFKFNQLEAAVRDLLARPTDS